MAFILSSFNLCSLSLHHGEHFLNLTVTALQAKGLPRNSKAPHPARDKKVKNEISLVIFAPFRFKDEV